MYQRSRAVLLTGDARARPQEASRSPGRAKGGDLMTVTDIPASPAGSTLAPYKAANGDLVLPGCYGVSHGAGITGELIRHATESWAGHAFVYVGNGQIIEAAPPYA